MANDIGDRVRRELVDYLIAGLKDSQGVHVEDLISAAAAIVGERCIEAAGDFSARRHQFTPGSPVFSDAVNELLAGNVSTNIADVPPDSVFGRMRDHLTRNGYDVSEFPDIAGVFRSFADGVGKGLEWGWVPLTLSTDNRPFRMPLRVAYETRAAVDRILEAVPDDRGSRLIVVTLSLVQVLVLVRKSIAPSVALLLAFETVNGMAKTAPMTAEAFAQVAREARSAANVEKKPWWRFW